MAPSWRALQHLLDVLDSSAFDIDMICNITKQDAQLSQRDRAAGCVIVFPKSRTLELGDNDIGHYRSIFNHCHTIGLKICRIP